MNTEVIEYKDEDHNIKLTIAGPANTRMGMHRSMLINQQEAIMHNRSLNGGEEDDTMVAAEAILRTVYYPAFIAGTVEQEGFDHWPISPEEFMELPEAFMIRWEIIWTLNPQWAQIIPLTKEQLEEAEKKVMKHTTGS